MESGVGKGLPDLVDVCRITSLQFKAYLASVYLSVGVQALVCDRYHVGTLVGDGV